MKKQFLSNALQIPLSDDDDDESNIDGKFYDAIDHFSDDSDDDVDDEQAPEDDVSNMVVKFKPFTIWNNSEDNEVEYILPPNFVDGSADWIGIYPEDYSGFDEYLGYEYTETHGDKAYSTARTVKIEFSASIDLPLKGKFVFLYFQSTGLRGYSSMLGTSDPFTVVKRCPTPRPDDID